MKPIPISPDAAPLLAFGAHPDDLEFAVGAVIAKEARPPRNRPVHLVVCSRGESASRGTPIQRTREAQTAARILGASLHFLKLDGDAHLQIKLQHTLTIAALIRRHKPSVVLAPTPVENQHPDHVALSMMVRDAARLARYAGIRELKKLPAHAIDVLFFYATTVEAEPPNMMPVLIDISEPEIVATWTSSMEAHASQMKTRNYVELQLMRARLHGLRAGVQHAVALYPSDPLIFESLAPLERSLRQF